MVTYFCRLLCGFILTCLHAGSLVFVFVLGCSGSAASDLGQGGSSGTSSTSSTDVTGHWTGTWLSRIGVSGTETMKLTQSGATVQGDVQFTGSPCFAGGVFNGTIRGTELTGTVSAGSIRVQFDGTVSSGTINGTYEAGQAGACSADTGTLTLSR